MSTKPPSNLFEELKQRALVQDLSDQKQIQKELSGGSLTFYCGFDPTSDSLHVGSLLPLTMMKRLQAAGHKPLALVGSGTGMIGDPSGKSEERVLLGSEQISSNISGISAQITTLLGENFELVENGKWLEGLNLVEFLRDVGKHFSVNQMMAKDSVKSRLENREQGISYTEFSYMLLQAYDFYHLYQEKGCRLQIGGSDQWGNITEGIELIRRKTSGDDKIQSNKALGFTFPLLTTSSGAKFGKTEKGAVWLSAERTSPYEFYQYWINQADQDALKMLNFFSFRSVEEIAELKAEHEKSPQTRMAQKALAEELTSMVHGSEEVKKAETAAQVFFGGSVTDLPGETLVEIFSDVPSSSLSKSELEGGIDIVDLLVNSELEKSKGAAKRSISGGGVYLNNQRVEDAELKVTSEDLVDSMVLILRLGKKKYHLVRVT